MILSENPNPSVDEFAILVERGRALLQRDAEIRPEYYSKEQAQKLEKDVLAIMIDVAKGTPFENTMILKSGHKFPDIVSQINANKLYGIEVKSTTQNHWESFGNSVLESSRVDNVERIFIMFGKLCDPIEFKARPYEECLSDVFVTHYPRYHINMNLRPGETIFDKIGMDYDTVRQLPDPVHPFTDYYRRQLKPGETLWWLGQDGAEEEHNMKIRLFSTLDRSFKDALAQQGLAYFPEMIRSKNGRTKYNNFVLWLVAKYGVVNTSTRDHFTAGGRIPTLEINGKIYENLPRIFQKINDWKDHISYYVETAKSNELIEHWQGRNRKLIRQNKRLQAWMELAAEPAPVEGDYQVIDILRDIFSQNGKCM